MSSDSEYHQQDDQQSADWRPMAYAILRSRHIILVGVLIGGVLGFVSAALKPNLYEAVGTLMLNPGFREAMTPDAGVTGGGPGGERANVREAVANELEILSNPALIEQVVRAVGPERILAPYDPAASDSEGTPAYARLLHRFQSWWFAPKEGGRKGRPTVEAAAEVVGQNLARRGRPRSTVIEVSYTSHSPEVAEKIVDAFLKVAVEHHQKVFNVGSRLVGFLSDEENAARQAYRIATRALTEFQIESGIFDLETERASLVQGIAQLKAGIENDKSQMEGLKRRLALIETELNAEDDGSYAPEPQQALNPEWTRLQTLLSQLVLRKLDYQRREGETPEDSQTRRRELLDYIAATEKQLEVQPMYLDQDMRRRERWQARYEVKENLALLEGTLSWRRERLGVLKTELEDLERLKPQYLDLELEVAKCEQWTNVFTTAAEKFDVFERLNAADLSNLNVLQDATLPTDKVGPNRFKTMVIALMLASFLGMVLAIGRGLLDSRVRIGAQATKLGSPVLAVVREGRKKDDPHGDHPFPALRDTTDALWSKLALEVEQESEAKVAFLAAQEGDGTTVIATCAAIGLAQHLRQPVVLVETSFHNPTLTRYLGLPEGPGLAEVLHKEASLAEAVQRTRFPGLSVLGAGGGAIPEPGMLATEHGYNVLRELARDQRYVIFDLPPPGDYADSRLLLWNADAAVAVMRAGHTRSVEAKELVQTIREAKTKLLGTVINRYRPVRPFFLPEPRWAAAVDPRPT